MSCRHEQDAFEFGHGNTKIDPAVLERLPPSCQVTLTKEYGVSFWGKTGRIDVAMPDRSHRSFFLKVLSDKQARGMVYSEFESMKTLYSIDPQFVPRPIACGNYKNDPNKYYYLCSFHDMTEEIKDRNQFVSKLSNIHTKHTSPNGKFGFHMTTFAGNLPQYSAWESSWEAFFAKSMRQALDLEIQKQGPSKELDALSMRLFAKVIPRLLRPLESGGRKLKPALVHGDLWHANAGWEVAVGRPLVFDACCLYAHHEYELGQWKAVNNKFGKAYIEAYVNHAEVSEPKKDFEDRLTLYRLRFDTHVSALFGGKEVKGHERFREQVIEVMRGLVTKFAP